LLNKLTKTEIKHNDKEEPNHKHDIKYVRSYKGRLKLFLSDNFFLRRLKNASGYREVPALD